MFQHWNKSAKLTSWLVQAGPKELKDKGSLCTTEIQTLKNMSDGHGWEGKVWLQGGTGEPLREITYMQKTSGRVWRELARGPAAVVWLLHIEHAQRSPQASGTALVMYCCAINYPKGQWLKTTVYYAHGLCGSGISIGNCEDGLSLLQDVWSFHWKTQSLVTRSSEGLWTHASGS